MAWKIIYGFMLLGLINTILSDYGLNLFVVETVP